MTREEDVTDERWSDGLKVDEVERCGAIDGEEAMVDGWVQVTDELFYLRDAVTDLLLLSKLWVS